MTEVLSRPDHGASAGTVRSVLVVDLLGGLGDMIMALPSIHALAEHHPGAEVTVLTHAASAVLLERDPAVDRVVVAEHHHERVAVDRTLADLRPDLAVTTTRFAGIGDTLDADAATRGTRAVTNLWRRPPADELVGERYQRILAAEGVVAPGVRPPRIVLGDDERAAGRAEMAPFGPRPVVLVPDAGMAVKRWPAARWSALTDALVDAGRSVLAVGDVSGAFRLPDVDLRALAARFAAVGEAGGVVVGPDTGPVRLAAAAGARTVGLFGPTAAARYGIDEPGGPPAVDLQGLPQCPHRRATAITEQVCWWEARCPLSSVGPACLLDLSVPRVVAAVGG